jgi:hypothetical protein
MKTFIQSFKVSKLQHIQFSGMENVDRALGNAMTAFSMGLTSTWFPIVLALASVRSVKRLGSGTSLQILPIDLLRRILSTLGWGFRDYSAILSAPDAVLEELEEIPETPGAAVKEDELEANAE